MGRCLYCNITVKDDTEICPLCHCVLSKDIGHEDFKGGYPNIVKKIHKLQLASRIYLFGAVMTEILLIYLNYRFLPSYKWSVIPGCLLACGYLTLYYLVYGTRTSYSMDIILGVIALLGMIDTSDVLLGDRRWSVNFVQPGVLMGVNVFLLVMVIISRRGWQTYLTAQLVMLIFSLCAIPLVITGQVTHPLVSIIAIAISIISFMGSLILGGSRSKEELYRKFHI